VDPQTGVDKKCLVLVDKFNAGEYSSKSVRILIYRLCFPSTSTRILPRWTRYITARRVDFCASPSGVSRVSHSRRCCDVPVDYSFACPKLHCSTPHISPTIKLNMKLLSASCLILLRSSNAFSSNKATSLATKTTLSTYTRSFTSSTRLKMSDKPFSVIVEAEIKEDRMEEFMTMIENNANKSRQEPGCIRFGTRTRLIFKTA
jgi:hypothetical protein